MARILVLDAAPVIDRLQRQLSPLGHEIIGVQADAYTALGHVAGANADLIMISLNLPGGGGAQVVQRLRAEKATAQTPVVLLFEAADWTGGFESDTRTRLLQKPSDFDTAKLTLDELLPRGSVPKSGAAPQFDENDGLPPLGPPSQSGRSMSMDMGAPSDEDLPPGETIEL